MPSETGFDRLRLKNVRCFRDAEIPLDERVTVIVGGNASGKTTLLGGKALRGAEVGSLLCEERLFGVVQADSLHRHLTEQLSQRRAGLARQPPSG